MQAPTKHTNRIVFAVGYDVVGPLKTGEALEYSPSTARW